MNEQIDIAVIRARVAAATPGPWVRGIARDDDGWAVLANDGDDEVCTQPPSRVIDPYSPADADLIAHAPTDIAALCDEVERLRAELDDARNVALGAVEDCAGLRASLEEISEASIDLIAAGDKLRASNERLRNVVERDALRAVIAGRTTTPTGAEVDAHPGAFLWMRMDRGEAVAVTHDGCEREAFDSIAFGFVWFREDLDDELPRATGARWWPLDASGAPGVWPVVTKEVDRG